MSNLPRIVVVDSSKAPDEQKRTQITIYNPKKDNSAAAQTTAAATEKSNKRSNRVQRRIDSSKSKLSSVSAISATVINMNQEGEKVIFYSLLIILFPLFNAFNFRAKGAKKAHRERPEVRHRKKEEKVHPVKEKAKNPLQIHLK